MRFRIRKRRYALRGQTFEAVPAHAAPDWYPTASEVQVIALATARGLAEVGIPVVYSDGERVVNFCGSCGRAICHPSCPRHG